MRRLAWVVVAVLAAVALAFGADAALRAYAEKRMEAEIDRALPAGVSTPGLTVTVRGFSFLPQYLAGNFRRVDVEAPVIATERGAVSATLEARDVRFDSSFTKAPVLGAVDGSLRASEDAVNNLVELPDPTATVRLDSRTVSYLATTTVLGLPLSYSAAVRPVADGAVIKLYPETVDVTSGPVHFDVKQLLGGVFDGQPIDVCIAPYLPAGLNVGEITIAKGNATIGFHAVDFSLAQKTFEAHSACPKSTS